MSNGPVAADELRLLIERVERLEEEKKAIADDIKSVYGEAKSRGFCPKTMRRIVALRKLDDNERREIEAMLDLYKAALGMLDGTPLGNWAVEKLKKDKGDKDPSARAPTTAPAAETPQEPAEPEAPQPTIDDARQLGAQAARDGKQVTDNPFPPRDPRRAAWDEAWCRELGSDGMEIPEALRPAGRKPKGDDVAALAEPAEAVAGTPAPTNSADTAPDGVDPAYDAARKNVIYDQYASVSRIQKMFQIGYNRAAKIMEQLESDGVVSAADLAGKREVLIDKDGNPK